MRRRAAAVPSSSVDVGSSSGRVANYDALYFPFPTTGKGFMRWVALEETALWDAGLLLSAVLLTQVFFMLMVFYCFIFFFLFRITGMSDASLWLGFAAVAVGSFDVLLSFSTFFLSLFAAFPLPLAVDYTSYGRGLPTRVFRTFEFFITPAWSCLNSAGPIRVDSPSPAPFCRPFSDAQGCLRPR